MTKNTQYKITNNTQRRILFIIAILLGICISGLYLYIDHENTRVLMLLKDEEKENTGLLEKIVQFKSSGLNAYANDYTYWDEMVDFVEKTDTSWAIANIDASMSNYNAEWVWVFDKDFSLRYFTGLKNTPLIDTEVVSGDMLMKVSANSRFFHFFILDDSLVIELSGATIHPTLDPNRISDPKGYFVAGRLWSKKLLLELSGLTGSIVALRNIHNSYPQKALFNDNEYEVKSFLSLKDFEGNGIAEVVSTREITVLRIMHEQTDRNFIIIIMFASMVFMFSGFSLYYLINLPLKMISLALTENDGKHLKILLKKNNEFGNIARLVNEFFMQREKLLNEIEERTAAEMQMRLSEEKLKGTLLEKEALIKEVHHRVKNNLQIVISLIRLQVNRIQDENITGHLFKILNRIRSISLVHEMLYRSPNLSRINFNEYICKLTESLRTIYIDEARDISIEVSAEDILLGVNSAVPCAIIINELVTNSIKHAFKDSEKGIIKISVVKKGNEFEMKVADNGIGICDKIDITSIDTLGMHLVTSLSDQIDAVMGVECSNGTAFTFRFPAE